MTKWQLFVDGASRNNPGPSGAGIYLAKNGEKILAEGFYLGSKTNNQAEYLALAIGLLSVLPKVKSDHLQIFSDSKLLVSQVRGIYKVKNPYIKEILPKIMAMLNTASYDIVHILRDKNQLADRMANIGVDRKVAITPELKEKLKQYEVDL